MTNRKALQKILMLNFLLILMAILAVNAGAKAVAIQNETVNMLVVNGTTGNILLNPNAGFGSVGIGTAKQK